jgi:hypothetical protein
MYKDIREAEAVAVTKANLKVTNYVEDIIKLAQVAQQQSMTTENDSLGSLQ